MIHVNRGFLRYHTEANRLLTAADAGDAFLQRDWSANTRRSYVSDLKRFTQAFCERPVGDLTSAELQDYLNSLTAL